MVRDDKNLTGNARFEGFCIDLLRSIANQVGFQYQLRLVPDHMYGVYDPQTKKWNGIVRELIERVSTLSSRIHINLLAKYVRFKFEFPQNLDESQDIFVLWQSNL